MIFFSHFYSKRSIRQKAKISCEMVKISEINRFFKARKAVARHAPGSGVTADDVIMTSGCSHGLEISLEALSNPGDNVLVPAPGFLLYSMLTRPRGVEVSGAHIWPHFTAGVFYRIVYITSI